MSECIFDSGLWSLVLQLRGLVKAAAAMAFVGSPQNEEILGL